MPRIDIAVPGSAIEKQTRYILENLALVEIDLIAAVP